MSPLTSRRPPALSFARRLLALALSSDLAQTATTRSFLSAARMHSVAGSARGAARAASGRLAAAIAADPPRGLVGAGARPWWWACSSVDAGRRSLTTQVAAAADGGGGEAGAAEAEAAAAPVRARPRRRAAAAASGAEAAATPATAEAAAVPPPARARRTRRANSSSSDSEADGEGNKPRRRTRTAAAGVGAPPTPRARRGGSGAKATTTTLDSGPAAPATAAADAEPTTPINTAGNTLYIIDLLAQAHRMAHGLAPANLATADGRERTGVAHGLAQLVLSLLQAKGGGGGGRRASASTSSSDAASSSAATSPRTRPAATHMAVVVDAPGATWRHERYPQYKAQRLPSPPGFREEVGRALELLAALGLPILAVPGVEADDVVASLAVRALRARAVVGGEGGESGGDATTPTPITPLFFSDVVIVSPDKDFFQLLSLDASRLSLLRLVKTGAEGNTGSGGGRVDGNALTTARDFLRLRPELAPWGCAAWADVLALMGDSSDNVPGVKGVGEKTALALVGACGGVEAVLEAARGLEQEEEKGAVEGKKAHRRTTTTTSSTSSNNNNPLAGVKLNRKQREVLASAEGRAAARLALDLVTVQKDLRVPPLRDLGPWGGAGGEEEEGEYAARAMASSSSPPPASDLREALRLRVPADGGARLMAVLDALEMRKTSEQFSKLLRVWASEGRV